MTRLEAIQEAMAPWLLGHMSPGDLPRAIEAGIEAGFAWHEGDEALRGEGAMGSEEESALDIVLRYISEQRSWRLRHRGAAGDAEFQVLKERVDNILGAWETRKEAK